MGNPCNLVSVLGRASAVLEVLQLDCHRPAVAVDSAVVVALQPDHHLPAVAVGSAVVGDFQRQEDLSAAGQAVAVEGLERQAGLLMAIHALAAED